MKVLVISKLFPPNNSARALQIGKVVESLVNFSDCKFKVIAGISKDYNLLQQQNNYIVTYIPYREFNSNSYDNLLTENKKRIMERVESFKWVKSSIRIGKNICEEFEPDVILSSSFPFDSHLVGLQLKKLYPRCKWIVSMSDPLLQMCPKPYYKYRPIYSKIQLNMMRHVINKCDALHMPSKQGIDLVQQYMDVPILSKSWAIQHVGTTPVGKNIIEEDTVTGKLVHLGELSSERVSKELLLAIKAVAIKNKNVFNGLVLVGKVCKEFLDLANTLQVNHLIHTVGVVSSAEAAEIASLAPALLVIEANMTESPFLPSKFADYALTKRPIIAITPAKSSIREYLDQYGGGYAVSHNAEEIGLAIEQAIITKKLDNIKLSKIFSPDYVAIEYRKMFDFIIRQEVCDISYKKN